MNRYLDEKELVKLFSNIFRNGDSEENSQENMLLKDIEKFINKDFIEFAREDSPPHNAELFYNFLYEFERFSEFVEFPKLAGKNIVGLGGAFSSGKSSFLNSFTGRKILPVQITPTTSIPTYMINGAEENIGSINIFNKQNNLDEDALKIITHDFKENYGISLAHILKLIFIEMPEIKHNNISFLDTPGYSKPDTESYGKNTDEKLAKAQLNSCNYIMWFVDAEGGTIKEEDIKFLEDINKNIPILIIISKADKKQDSIKEITELTRKTVIERGLNVKDVIAYSSRKPDMFPKSEIEKHLNKWDKEKVEITFAKNFKKIFTEFSEYFDDEIRNERKRLNRINKLDTMIDTTEEDTSDYIKTLKTDALYKIKKLEERVEELQKIKTGFFTLIKKAGDYTGIPLPEPKDIDMINDRIISPLKLIREYKTEKKIKDENFEEILIQELSFDEEIFFFKRYKVLEQSIKSTFDTDDTDIEKFKENRDMMKFHYKTISGIKDIIVSSRFSIN